MKLSAFIFISLFFSCNTKKEIVFPDGGYDFVKGDTLDAAFPYFPLKKLIPPGDSFYYSYYDSKMLNAFNEPNISLRPAAKPAIRMIYKISVGATYIISLYEDSIVVKKSLGSLFNQNEENMTQQEFFQMGYLDINFPLERNERINSPGRVKFRDSLIKLYPQLTDPAYYISLLNKFNAPPAIPFKYSRKVTAITRNQYYRLVDGINKSGYWKFPLHLQSCKSPWTDGAGFMLEMNTGRKYNNVSAGNCVARYKEYGNACQRMLDLARIDRKEIDVLSMFLDE